MCHSWPLLKIFIKICLILCIILCTDRDLKKDLQVEAIKWSHLVDIDDYKCNHILVPPYLREEQEGCFFIFTLLHGSSMSDVILSMQTYNRLVVLILGPCSLTQRKLYFWWVLLFVLSDLSNLPISAMSLKWYLRGQWRNERLRFMKLRFHRSRTPPFAATWMKLTTKYSGILRFY